MATAEKKYQRVASAPNLDMTSIGSTEFFSDLLILRPCLSSTVPLTITFLKDGCLNNMVPMASRLKNQPRVWSTPSAMKSAGNRALKSSSFSNG